MLSFTAGKQDFRDHNYVPIAEDISHVVTRRHLFPRCLVVNTGTIQLHPVELSSDANENHKQPWSELRLVSKDVCRLREAVKVLTELVSIKMRA